MYNSAQLFRPRVYIAHAWAAWHGRGALGPGQEGQGGAAQRAEQQRAALPDQSRARRAEAVVVALVEDELQDERRQAGRAGGKVEVQQELGAV